MTFFALSGSFSVLLVVVTWTAAAGWLPANGVIGLRTPALLRSEEGWRAGHRAALAVLLPLCVAVLGMSGFVGAVRPWDPATTEVVGGMLLVVLLASAVVATWRAHRRATAVASPPGRDG